jgi:hypothetical protein
LVDGAGDGISQQTFSAGPTVVASGVEELENAEAPEEESSQTMHATPNGSACGSVEKKDPEGETEEIPQQIRRAR